jgi:hypothetical protein
MTKFLFVAAGCFVLAAGIAAAEDRWETAYGELLEKYVTPGGVRYQAWKANAEDLAKLDGVVKAISAPEAGGEGKARMAFLLNAYNAWVLKRVLDLYPLKSVSKVYPEFQFFKRNDIKVAGESLSFDKLEKSYIGKEFGDPRYHFAINCASRSCPPLLAAPFAAETIEAQLQAVTESFLGGHSEGVRTGPPETIAVSSLFDWYGDAFKQAPGAQGSVIGYINLFRKDKLPANAKIAFLPYSWDLNESP